MSPTAPRRLDDGIEAFLAALPGPGGPTLDIAEKRLMMRRTSDQLHQRFGHPGPPVAAIRQLHVPGRRGSVRLRWFEPKNRRAGDAHILLHGGGWWHGSPDELVVEAGCRSRAVALGAPVLAIDYALAPEHPFPAALDDLVDVWSWLSIHAETCGVDVRRTSVGGASAGANLAAALCIRLRDEGFAPPLFQLLEVPALDLTGHHSLKSGVPDRFGLSTGELRSVFDLYVPHATAETSAYASPLRSADLAGLPAAHVMTSEWDPVRHEGDLYAARLRDAGVAATSSMSVGGIHGSISLTRAWDRARVWQDEVLATLAQAHGVEATER